MFERAQLPRLFEYLSQVNGDEPLRAAYECVKHASGIVGLGHQQTALKAMLAVSSYRFKDVTTEQSCDYWAGKALWYASDILGTTKPPSPSNIKVRATGQFSLAAGWLAKAAVDYSSQKRYFDLLSKAVEHARLCGNLAEGYDNTDTFGPEDAWQEEFLSGLWCPGLCLVDLDAPRFRTSLLAERTL